jgi:hypothetical protein
MMMSHFSANGIPRSILNDPQPAPVKSGGIRFAATSSLSGRLDLPNATLLI